MRKVKNLGLGLLWGILVGCGFHLRGQNGNFQFPFQTVYLDCTTPIICPGLRSTMQHESLTRLMTRPESAEVTILVSNEQTSRDTLDFNSTGQIASYILTYSVTAQVFTPKGDQIGSDILVRNQMIMNYNNSLILSSQQQEISTWDQIHQSVINSLIRRLVYFKIKLMSPSISESQN